MATAVQIELMVDEKGAVQGIRAFDTAVKGSAGSVKQLGNELELVRNRAATAGQQGRAAMEQVGAGSLSALEKTRLLSEEFGIHLPRAMVKLTAESKAVQIILGSIGTAMVGLGAIQIGAMAVTQLYDGAKKLYEKWFDVAGAVKSYQEEARKAAAIKLFDEGSFQTQLSMLSDVSRELDQLQQKKQAASGFGSFMTSFLGGSGFDYFSAQDQKRINALQTQQDQSNLAAIEKRRNESQRQIEDAQRTEVAAAPEYARAGIEHRFDYQRAESDQSFTRERDTYLTSIYNRGQAGKNIKAVPTDAGSQEKEQAFQDADAKLNASQKDNARTTTLEIQRLNDQAQQAMLRGYSLLEAQRVSADREWVQQHGSSTAAVQAIDAKYYAEEKKLTDEQRRQTEEMQGQAALAGFKGIGSIQARGDLDIAKINDDPELSEQTKQDRVAAVRIRVNAEILESERTFTEQVNTLADESTDHQLTGFARIQAAAQRAIDDKERAFKEEYGQADQGTPEGAAAYQRGLSDLGRAKRVIGSNANYDSSQLSKQNANETFQIESEARSKLLSAERQQTAAIEAEYDARVQKYRDQLTANEISQDDFNRRVVAAEEVKNAQLVDAARAAREKMAGEFDTFFKGLDHPLKALASLGEKVAGQATAALVQRIQNRSGSSGEHLGLPGGNIFDKIAGVDHKAETAGRSAIPGAITMGTAQIHIQAASIILAGASAAQASAGGAFGVSSGGTGASSWSAGGSTSSAGGGFSGAGDIASASVSGGAGAGISMPSSLASGIIGDASAGAGLIKQAGSIFGSRTGAGGDGMQTTSVDLGGSFDKNGNWQPGGNSNGGILGGGGLKKNAMGALGGALGLFSAAEGNGGIGGAASGAMSGMQFGMALGGPIGAAVGAAGGAVLGLLGLGGRGKAEDYDNKTVKPQIAQDEQSFETGGDYLTAYGDLQTLDTTAERTTKQWGPAAHSYYNNTIRNEINQAKARFSSMERAGRSDFSASTAFYASGTDSVRAMLTPGERVIPSDQNERITRALESGAGMDTVAKNYRTAMQASTRSASSSRSAWSGDLHVHAIDAQGVREFLDRNKHGIRAAVNSSLSENSGGSDAGF